MKRREVFIRCNPPILSPPPIPEVSVEYMPASGYCRLEIRLVCARDGAFLEDVGCAPVLRADMLRPFAERATVCDGGRPGHREDAFIFHRELELQSLAP